MNIASFRTLAMNLAVLSLMLFGFAGGDDDVCLLPDQTQQLLSSKASGAPVVLLATTSAHVSFAQTLVHSMERLSLLPYLVIMTPDDDMLRECRARGWHFCGAAPASPPPWMRGSNSLSSTARNGTVFEQHSPAYNRFTWARIRYIYCVLLSGHAVLFLDTDSVFTPTAPSGLGLLSKVLDPALGEVSVSCDNLSGPLTNPAMSAWQPTREVLELLRAWQNLEPPRSKFGDMRGLKMLLRGHHGPAELHRNKTGAWGAVQVGSGKVVRWRCLSLREFCSCGGKRQRGIRSSSADCTWIHMNCLASRAKIPAMRRMGLWWGE